MINNLPVLPDSIGIILVIAGIDSAVKALQSRTAWRIEGTLREFPKFAPVDVWFDYPVHKIDSVGVLKDINPDEQWKQNFSKKKNKGERKQERKDSIETAFSAVSENNRSTVKALAEYLGVTEKTVRNRLKEHGGFWIDESECGLKS